MKPRILMNDFQAQWAEIGADTIAAVSRVGQSGWYILGEEVTAFERALAAQWGLAEAIGCGNGLDAIEISLRCLKLAPGAKVLTTPLSAFATTLAIVRAGGAPVFVDTDASGLIDLDLCEKALAEDRAIRVMVPVHLYGHALDLSRLAALKSRFGLQVVEDCAQAIGARSGGKPVGSVGQLAATSFYPTKNLGALGDGGAVLTDSVELARAARCLRDYGQSAKYVHSERGLNSRLDELQAAILASALLPRLPVWTERRRAVARRYREGIRHPRISVPPTPHASESVWHLFPIVVEGDRESLRAHLASAGVAAAVHYPKLISDQPALQGVTAHVLTPLTSAQRFADHELTLPIHPYLSEAQVDVVVEACNSWRAS